ncbi:MAG: GMC family oxidoreductase, partial [Burkholderiales bacterium]|nr:GMC family oxidoreductase [Burkholderiales bacterium]
MSRPTQPHAQDTLTFDWIIVGAGTAGCLLANRLAQQSDRRVLLVEAGGSDRYLWIHIPVGYLFCIGNPRTDWCFKTEAVPGLNGRSLRYPRGRVLGGSSSINGMIYMRGQARDYDHWAELTGEPAWRWDNVVPDFRAHEEHWRLDAGVLPAEQQELWLRFHGHHRHGSTGEWRIERQRLHWPILEAFRAALIEAGVPPTEDFNRGDNEGVAYFEVNQRSGVRWNARKAFLNPVLGRPNLTVWLDGLVERLTIERDPQRGLVATGVVLRRRKERLSVRATQEVILAAGAIGSVQLLERSGIGQAERLHALGIPPLLDRRGVGENLQDHLQLRAVYRVEGAQTLNTRAASLWGRLSIGIEYLLFRRGPMAMAPSQLGAFTRSDPRHRHPNVEFHVQPLSLPAFGEPLDPFDAITASVCNLNPTSRGSVHIQSPEPEAAPAIQPNYLATEEDRRVAAESLRLVRRVVAQPALARFAPRELRPGLDAQSDEALVRAAGDIGTTIFHPVGTAR